MSEVVIKFLQGSAVTQTALGEQAVRLVANVVECMVAKNYENRLTVKKVIAIIKG